MLWLVEFYGVVALTAVGIVGWELFFQERARRLAEQEDRKRAERKFADVTIELAHLKRRTGTPLRPFSSRRTVGLGQYRLREIEPN